MSLLPLSIPRATEAEQLYEEPLGFLASSRARLGDIFVIRDGGPIFSRAAECAGAVVVFGAAHQQAVLSDIELYGMPVSAAEHLALPASLINLNRGLHSMRGEQHAQHQRLLLQVLGERSIEDHHHALGAAVAAFADGWQAGQRISLLSEMRRLALQLSTRLLFGNPSEENSSLASLLQTYFHLRREAVSPFSAASESLRDQLIALGISLDGALRRHLRACRENPGLSDGIISRLSNLELKPGRLASEDELVAHANVLFVSSTEPVAVALTWMELILSQLPELRAQLRRELGEATPAGAIPPWRRVATLSLLDAVVNESLRLLTPNALMVRVTTRAAALNGVSLPERCEIVLCPFLAHRDAARFPRPEEFQPSRWEGIRPSSFEYFPFGAGGHSCVGRHLAIYIIKTVLASLLPRWDLVLTGDQEIDWRIHIMFMPRNEPLMTVCAPDGADLIGGELRGPVSELIKFTR